MTSENHVLGAARQVVINEGEAVLAVANQLDQSFIEVVDLLTSCNGKVFVTGSGTSGAIARRMAHLLAVCGTPSSFIHPMDALHGTMGVLTAGDVLMSISRGGESDEINQLSARAKERDIKIVAITAAPESGLAQLADITVVLKTEGEGDPGGVIAMGSTLVTAVWGDALANILMRRRNYSWDEFMLTHPAGAVGKITDLPQPLGSIDS